MFNFTTQTVYNEIATLGAKKNLWVVTGKKPSLRIGNTRFDKGDVLDIQMKNPSKESLASVTFDMSKVLIPSESTDLERTARIVLYVGLSMNSQDALYTNDFVYKGKPMFIEFPVKKSDDAASVAKRVKAIADKFLLFVTQEKILDVIQTSQAASGNDAATGTVTFKGVNGYQQIKSAVLQIYDDDAETVDCCSNHGAFVDLVKGVPVIYTINSTTGLAEIGNPAQKLGEAGPEAIDTETEVAIAPGLEAFGDYNWIIHNLRLPTAANTNFWAPTKLEMPIPGQEYVQFIVRLIKERDGIMGEIVGARGTSVTTHVLYVAKPYATQVQTELAKVLNTGETIKTDADDKLDAPYE